MIGEKIVSGLSLRCWTWHKSACQREADLVLHLPSLPLTRDRQLLVALRRSLAVYRLVFGQPRQDDLVEYLVAHVPPEQLEQLVERLKINLSP